MAILGRGITGLPLTTDSLIVGVGGVLDELPVGTLNQILTVTASGVDWADSIAGEANSGTNLAGGGAEVFAGKTGVNLEFRTINAGSGILVTESLNSITIENTAAGSVTSVNGDSGPAVILTLNDIDDVVVPSPSDNDLLTWNSSLGQWEAAPPPVISGGEINDGVNIGTGAGVFSSKSGVDLQFRSLSGINGITTAVNGNVVEIDGSAINGTVTSVNLVDANAGSDFVITGGPITTSGSINIGLAATGVVANTYANPVNLTVDAKGRITSVSSSGLPSQQNLWETIITNGSGALIADDPSDVLTLSGINGIETAIGFGDVIEFSLEDLTLSGLTAGSYSAADITVDSYGRITAVADGTVGDPDQNVFVTFTGDTGSTTANTTTDTLNINGGAGIDTAVAGDVLTITLENTAVTAGSYTNASITVDAQGRITSASSGSVGLTDVVNDTTPQLGGNLDVQANSITTSVSNGSITIAPQGTGTIVASSKRITSVANPIGAQDAATKNYVDSKTYVLNDLTNVNTGGAVSSQVLQFNGTNWVPGTVGGAQNIWSTFNADTGSTTADTTSDTFTIAGGAGISTSIVGDVLTIEGLVVSIDDLSDVDTSTIAPATNDIIAWNGSQWTPDTLAAIARTGAYADLSGVPVLATVATSGDYTDLINTPSVPVSIDDLSDVDTSTVAPAIGEVLSWNGSQWTPITLSNTGINSLIEDTTPQLGGNLDVQANIITTSTTNGNITLDPNGTGSVSVSTSRIINIVDPVNPQDAATMNYVDTEIAALSVPTIISDLSDVNTVGAGSGQALVFNGSIWVPQSIGGAQNVWVNILSDSGSTAASTTVDSLTLAGGIGISTSITGDTVVFNNTITNLNDLDDVNTAGVQDGYVLTYDNGSSTWLASPASSGSTQNLFETILADTGATTADSPNDILFIQGGTGIVTSISGDILTIENTASELAGLSDVDFSVTPISGQLFNYNGTNWVPLTVNVISTLATDSGSVASTSLSEIVSIVGAGGITTSAVGNTITITGSTISIDDLSDVDTSTIPPDVNDILIWSGSQWIPSPNAGGSAQNLFETILGDTGSITADNTTDILTIAGGLGITTSISGSTLTVTNDIASIDDLSDVDTTSVAPNIGEVLVWNGSQWAPDVVAGGGGISNIIEDTTPQLGGDLDVNGSAIVSTSNGDITLTPNGSGVIDLGGYIIQKKQTTAVTGSGSAVFDTYTDTFEASYIDYIFSTSSGSRTGTLYVAFDGSTLVSVADTGSEVGLIDISFTADTNAGNIEITYTENNGDSGTLTWTTRRMSL